MVTWMRRRLCFILLGLSWLVSGCSLVTDATCLTIFSVRQTAEDFSEGVRNRKWAELAWEDARRADLHHAYSEDYANGFKDGFAHYLYRGGHGEPPPLPPLHYRKVRYQTPQGYKAIEDWFAGFRHGADAARQSGYRYWITGPSALRAPTPWAPLPIAEPVQASSVPSLSPPERDQVGSAPPVPAPELELATLERPIPIPLPRPPAPLPPRQANMEAAPLPNSLSPRPQAQRPNAPLVATPLPSSLPPRPQVQRPSVAPPPVSPSFQQPSEASVFGAPAATAPLPTIINGGAANDGATNRQSKPLPTIINGESPSAGPAGLRSLRWENCVRSAVRLDTNIEVMRC
jgi:hypothetical protein